MRKLQENWRLGCLFWLLALVIVLAEGQLNAETDAETRCPWDRVVSVTITDYRLPQSVWLFPKVNPLESSFFTALEATPAEDTLSLWVGYDTGGWALPADHTPALWIVATLDDGSQRWARVDVAGSTPDTAYVWTWYSLEQHADVNGEHYGAHDFCQAMTLDKSNVEWLIS